MSEVTVDDLLTRAGLPREAANKKISDIHILDLSMKHCKKWRSLPAYLKMDQISVSDLQYAMGTESDKRKLFLERWQQEKGSEATYRALMEALLNVQCRDEAEYIANVLLKGDSTPGRTTTTTHSTSGASSGSGYATYTNGGNRATSHYDGYVNSLTSVASSYLDQELDWDNDNVHTDLNEIAEQIVDWEVKLSTRMGLTGTEIHDLKENNKPGILLRRAVLKKWKEKNAYNATYRALLKLCCDAKDATTAKTICRVLNEKAKEKALHPAEQPSQPPPPAPSEAAQPTASQERKPQEGKPRLIEVCKELKPWAERWSEVRDLLELTEEETTGLEMANLKPEGCLMKILKVWLNKTGPPPTWEMVKEIKEYLES